MRRIGKDVCSKQSTQALLTVDRYLILICNILGVHGVLVMMELYQTTAADLCQRHV